MPEEPTPLPHEPGEVVWASVFNSLENASSRGKQRPVVLITRSYGHWSVMGLTSKPQVRSGQPRVPVPHHATIGLRRRSHLWGDRLTIVSALDVGDHIGWVDLALAEMIIDHAGLSGWVARSLRASAERHHGDSPPPQVS